MKIALIGPVYPYRSGISHHTSLLFHTLAKAHDVAMISFSFQYPRFLFGMEQKDYSDKTFEIKEAQFLINTINPVSWAQVVKKINAMHADMVVIQWWHPYFAPCYQFIARNLHDAKILFLCHNVFPHKRFPMDRRLTQNTLKHGDCYIVQSQRDAKDLLSMFPDADYAQTVHPTYDVFKRQGMTQVQARKELGLGLDEKILLFFGFVSEYKGLRYLIQAMPDIVKEMPDIKLLIAGEFKNEENKSRYTTLINGLRMESHIRIFEGYVPNNEVEAYFSACDLVACPYEDATQSGIVQIAYGFDKPVVATNVGGLPDVVIDKETGYLTEPKNPTQIEDAIIRFFKNKDEERLTENVKKVKEKYSWERMRELVEGFLK